MRPIGMVDTMRATASAGRRVVSCVSSGPGLATFERIWRSYRSEVQVRRKERIYSSLTRCVDAERGSTFYVSGGAIKIKNDWSEMQARMRNGSIGRWKTGKCSWRPSCSPNSLSDPNLPSSVAQTLSEVPLIEIAPEYWQ